MPRRSSKIGRQRKKGTEHGTKKQSPARKIVFRRTVTDNITDVSTSKPTNQSNDQSPFSLQLNYIRSAYALNTHSENNKTHVQFKKVLVTCDDYIFPNVSQLSHQNY